MILRFQFLKNILRFAKDNEKDPKYLNITIN